MTIKECIDAVDNLKPNQYTLRDKVQWLSFVDEVIINDVLKTHEGYDGRYDDFTGYTEDDLTVSLIVQSPYDRLYPAFLVMKIDQENGETARYNNSASLFNSYMTEFRKYYNKTHMPLSVEDRKNIKPVMCKPSEHITEAQVEAITRDLYYMLSEDLNQATSDDKIYDIVMRYVNNNAQMLKGKDGKQGEDGLTPYIAKNGNWHIGDEDTGVQARGVDGTVTFDELSEEQKASLKGDKGDKGDKGAKGDKGDKGDQGEKGERGHDGADGITPDLTDYVQKTDFAVMGGQHGIVNGANSRGTNVVTLNGTEGIISIYPTTEALIDAKTERYRPITAYYIDHAVKAGIVNNTKGALSVDEIKKACAWLGAVGTYTDSIIRGAITIHHDDMGENNGALIHQEATQFYNYIHEGNTHLLDIPKVESVSYVGTGNSGEKNPCVLNFDFVPHVVLIWGDDNANSVYPLIRSAFLVNGQRISFGFTTSYTGSGYSQNYLTPLHLTWDNENKTVSYYSNNGADQQLNMSGKTYRYMYW